MTEIEEIRLLKVIEKHSDKECNGYFVPQDEVLDLIEEMYLEFKYM